jgi:hypothetical protein
MVGAGHGNDAVTESGEDISMALSNENANLVWQKVNIALDTLAAKSEVRDAFRALKAHLSQVKRNPDLTFVAISDLTADVVAADAACKVYGIFLKKQATATDAFYKLFDDAATDSSAEDAVLGIRLVDSGDQVHIAYPAGLAMAAGAVHGSFTAMAGAAGTTASTTGDGPNGFLLLGAA